MSLVRALQAERISHLELGGFLRVERHARLEDVLSSMRTARASVVLVEEPDGRLAGIFTERDVLLKIAAAPHLLLDPIERHMTSQPQTVSTAATAGEALRLMNEGHYRNVPVVDADGHAVGNLGQEAVIRFLTDRYPRQIYNLPPDPELIPRTREGA